MKLSIEQKRIIRTLKFQFLEDILQYKNINHKNAESLNIDYKDIPTRDNYQRKQDKQAILGYLFAYIILMIVMANVLSGYIYSAVVFSSTIGFVWRVSSYKIIYIPVGDNDIVVLNNSDENTILNEIEKRRRNALLKHYGTIDYQSSPKTEIQKCDCLLQEGLIDQSSYEKRINNIKAYYYSDEQLLTSNIAW